MSPERAVAEIKLEIEEIDRLLESYSELLEGCRSERPGLVAMTAAASVVHSFYNGLENVFLSVAKRIDGTVPEGAHWHRDLLGQMAGATRDRTAVISEQTRLRLADYLGFRHFFRHAYSFSLQWEELRGLVHPLQQDWKRTRAELSRFLDSHWQET